MNEDLLKEIQERIERLSQSSGIPVHEIMLQVQQNIHMDKLRKVLLGSEKSKSTHINSVAVQVDGLVYSMPRPNRHRHIHHSLPDLPKMNFCIVGGIDGFINPQTGEFMDRENALQYALQVGQIKAPQWDETKLFSEDLW